MNRLKFLKILYLLPLIAATGGLTAACSSDDEKETLIPQLECAASVTSFFDNILPLNANDHIAYGFFIFPEYTRNDVCYVIDSMDELKNLYSEKHGPELPELNIDFGTNTLIVGQARATSENILPGRKLRQSLYDENAHYVLYLDYEGVDRNYIVELNDPGLVYYWGIYPKLHSKEVIVKVSLI